MALQQILLPILPTNYMKEMSLLQEMSLPGREHAILLLLLELSWQMLTGEDTGQLPLSQQFISL